MVKRMAWAVCFWGLAVWLVGGLAFAGRLAIAGESPEVAPELVIHKDNIVIDRSVRIKPGRYVVADRDQNGVLVVTADNVVVDFQGATLAATREDGTDLENAQGVGLIVSRAKNVTVKNAHLHGYFVNLRAVAAPGLTLENVDARFSRAQRIRHGRAPVPVWLHLRSLEAWRSYGAGFWLERCSGCMVRGVRATGAQNGLLLVDSEGGTIVESDFSFNSGWGLGLWGASRNTVAFNRIDFVNRPWGGGWGGDSAGLVVVNGSNENDIVSNSLTHGGDGFFLTDRRNGGLDGQRKTSSIEGSCDRNLVAQNDGSWSPCNAFEGTFSKGNIYYRNRASDSRYGFWLGYSDDTLLLGNEIQRNQVDGIAIEHGQGTRVVGNTFEACRRSAVALWSSRDWIDEIHPSRAIDIADNVIRGCGQAWFLRDSTDVAVRDNRIEKTPEPEFAFVDRTPADARAAFEASDRYRRLAEILKKKPQGFHLYRDGPGPRGIPWIQVGPYAPVDFRNDLVAWRERDAASLELHPVLAGPAEELRIDAPSWIEVTRDPAAGTWIAAAKQPDGPGAVKPYKIQVRRTGSGERQTLEGTFVTARWDVAWYRWDQPRRLAYDDAAGWKRLFRSAPIHTQTVGEASRKLWAGGMPPGVPSSHFALVARTRIRLPGGRYRLSTISDDGLRVFVDRKEVISRWNHHGPTPDRTEVKLASGVHTFVIHYCQESGASALEFSWERVGK